MTSTELMPSEKSHTVWSSRAVVFPEQSRIVAKLDVLPAEVDALKRLQGATAAEPDAKLHAILDGAFRGGLC
jgi:hypothetical protein